MSQNTYSYRHKYEAVQHPLYIYNGKGEITLENRIKQEFLQMDVPNIRENVLRAVQNNKTSRQSYPKH